MENVEVLTAFASTATALVAALALMIGYAQVRESRRLRIEQAQPYVAVFMEPSAASPQIVDVVVKNFGSTVALDVEIEASPPLKRSARGEGAEDVWLFSRLPVLVPGQEWRTLWDFAPERFKADLPDRHDVVVRYRDSRGRDLQPLAYVLDWGAFKGRQYVRVHSLHDAAKSLREMERTMKKWTQGIHGLSVYARDGDAYDARRNEEYESLRQEEGEVVQNEEQDGSDQQAHDD